MVRQLMLGQGLRLAAFGLGAGVLVSLAIARLLGSLLYGVSPYDPLSLALVSLALIAIGLIASWLPTSDTKPLIRVPPTSGAARASLRYGWPR